MSCVNLFGDSCGVSIFQLAHLLGSLHITACEFFLFWTLNAHSTFQKFKEILQAAEAAVKDVSYGCFCKHLKPDNSVSTSELQEKAPHDEDGGMWDKL